MKKILLSPAFGAMLLLTGCNLPNASAISEKINEKLGKIDVMNEKIDDLQSKMEKMQEKIDDLNERVVVLETKLEQKQGGTSHSYNRNERRETSYKHTGGTSSKTKTKKKIR